MAPAFKWQNAQNNSFVAAATSTNVGSTSAAGTNGSFTAGDILIALVQVQSDATDTIVAPSGWTQIGSQTVDADNRRSSWWWHLCNGSETGSFTFTWTTSNFSCWTLGNYSGCASSPIDGTPRTTTYTGGGSVTTGSVTTTNASDILILFNSNPADTITPDGSLTVRFNASQESSSAGSALSDRSPGSTGTFTDSFTSSGGSGNGAYMYVALKPAAASSIIVEQSFFDVVLSLKRPSEFTQGDGLARTSPALSGTFATSPFFEQTKLKQPIIDVSDITPSEPIKLAGERWFEPIQLKRPVIDNPPVLIPPAAVITATIVEQPFFEPIKLKMPSEFMQGPFAGTSPALTTPYVTQAFFEQTKLKQPIIDKPSDMTPLVSVVNFSATNWFDAVKLLKLPERFIELYPQQFWTPESYDAWFEQIKLLKLPERMQEAFGLPFPPPILETSAFFDTVRIKQPPPSFDFLQATAQSNTVQNALTDWFATVKLKQPVVETPLVVYFPAQVIPTFTAEYEVMFFANVGKLMGH